MEKENLFIEETLNNSLQRYFDALSIDKKLKIIALELARFDQILSNQRIIVKYCAFEKERVKTLIHSVFTSCNIKEMREATREEMIFAHLFEGIIIEDEGATFICKAGLEQAKETMFRQIKDKVAKILFGGQF